MVFPGRLSPGADMDASSDLTELLHRAQAGDALAADALFQATYAELRRVAHARLSGNARLTLLDTTGLVHEWFVRFTHARPLGLEDRGAFVRYAARAMRSIVVDFARARTAARRGGDGAKEAFELASPGLPRQAPEEILAVHQALEELAALDPRMAEVVELRYFGGFTDEEAAEALGVTDRTVRRDWEKARAWLSAALE
jgi:RNA polymerase sigma factor (TIGR02999 family)